MNNALFRICYEKQQQQKTNKQTNKRTNKQTTTIIIKQINKQTRIVFSQIFYQGLFCHCMEKKVCTFILLCNIR